MAIRFGMSVAEMIRQLTNGFRSVKGRNPDGLELIKIQQEAVQRFKDMNKVVDMQGRTLDPSKTIMGGTQEGAALRSGIMKATGAKPTKAIKDFKKKMDEDRDYSIFDPEDMAEGGRIGYKDGPDQPGRRKFMKIMGGIASLPFIGKYLKPAVPLIQKGAEITAPALDKIIQTVMSAGKLISQSGRRVKEMVTKKKLKDVEVEEDIMDGPSYTIKTKDKTIYYRPGRQDEMGIDDDIIEVIESRLCKH